MTRIIKMKEPRMDNNGSCINLNEANFRHDVLNNNQPVMVEFRADWSGTCDIMSPILEELRVHYAGQIAIVLVDADKNKNLAREYGITYLPTFVFFKKGQVVDHIVGATPKPVMAAKLDRLLQNKG